MRALMLGAAFSVMAAPALAAGFTVTTPDFANGGTIPLAQVFKGFGCTGENHSPAVSWSGEPAGTKSFAVTMFDPDAPTGPPPDGRRGWWHWIAFNIPASTTSIPKNAGDVKAKLMPEGVIQSRNSYGFDGFGGMCPPKGDKPHHYTLTVYAVDEDKLQFAKDDMISPEVVGYETHFHSKATAAIHWTYGRAP
jgi:Raf kinase inhibitor-like YbhB/YbcL family protein